MSEEKKEEKMDRRKYIKYIGAGAVVAGAAAAIGYGISELTKPPPPTPTTIVTTAPPPTTVVTTVPAPTTTVITQPTTITTAATKEKKTVTWWFTSVVPYRVQLQNEIIAEFEKRHPDIEIRMELLPHEAAYQMLIASLEAGIAPDVVHGYEYWTSPLAAMGALEDLTDRVKEWGVANDFFPVVKELCTYEGKWYSIPFDLYCDAIYYRTDRYKELGLSIPKTTDDFLYNAKKLTRDVNGDGVIDEYGFGMRGAGYAAVYYATYFIYGWGGSVFKDGKVTINEPEAVEGFTWYVNLFKEHKVCPPSTPTDAWRGIVEGFGGGRTSMYLHNTGSFGEQINYLGLDKFSTMPFPICSKTGNRLPNFVGAEIFYIPKMAKYKDEAWEFVKFFSEKEQSIKYNLGITSIPPRKSFAESNEYKGKMPEQFYAFIEQLNYSMSNPYLKYPAVSAAVQTKFEAYFQAALLGKMTPKEALDKMAEDIKKALEAK